MPNTREEIVTNIEREAMWRERLAQWRMSGLSQRAYAIAQGWPVRQIGYWARRLDRMDASPAVALLPVRVQPVPVAPSSICLRGDGGWTLTLPADVPASWLAELMRAL
jgi:hypothetical protein